MKEKIVYISEDGKEFETKMLCQKYEEENKKLLDAMVILKEHCRCSINCTECPFYIVNGSASESKCRLATRVPENW